jgi:hypothetical protein
MSLGYEYRSSIRNNDPNLLHRVFAISHDVAEYRDLNLYLQRFPWISSAMPVDLTGTYTGNSALMVDTVEPADSTPTHRLHNLWNVVMYCTPHTSKAKVSSYFHYFHLYRHRLALWIDWLANTGEVNTVDNVRITQIVKFARSRGGNQLRQIQAILKNEYGESLYRLVCKYVEFTKME